MTMSMVLNSKTSEWSSGQTWEIVQELQDEFAPTDMMGEAEQQRELDIRIPMVDKLL